MSDGYRRVIRALRLKHEAREAMKPEPFENDGLWIWVRCSKEIKRPEQVWFDTFVELRGGEFREPPNYPEPIREYTSREAAIAALKEAAEEAEHAAAMLDLGSKAPYNLNG